jgi:hypothetical protein
MIAMKTLTAAGVFCCLVSLVGADARQGWEISPQFRELFNGRDLTGWINVNTAEDTWKFRDGLLICSGRPLGVLCSE